MRILIADDDTVSLRALECTLRAWDYDVVLASDGLDAWQILRGDSPPPIALLDWMMPKLDGAEVCRRVQAMQRQMPLYLILLTIKSRTEDVVDGLGSGANDYIVKPFDLRELRSRIQVGERTLALQESLLLRGNELAEALAQVKQLQGLLPICSYCHKIRDDSNYWQRIESYLSEHTNVQFSHGVCPECFDRVMAEIERNQVTHA